MSGTIHQYFVVGGRALELLHLFALHHARGLEYMVWAV